MYVFEEKSEMMILKKKKNWVIMEKYIQKCQYFKKYCSKMSK